MSTRPQALVAALLVALVIAACGDDQSDEVPANAVAMVDGEPISRTEFQHWGRIVRRSLQLQGLRPTEADVKRYVLGQLATAIWWEQEAKKLDVELSDERLDGQIERYVASVVGVGGRKRYEQQTGATADDIRAQARGQLLPGVIAAKVQARAAEITPEQVERYYDEHKGEFSTPERRNFDLIVTRARAAAQKARDAVLDGRAWAAVAKQYSSDPAVTRAGGRLLNVARGEVFEGQDAVVFGARRDELIGPLQSDGDWFIVRTVAEAPARIVGLEEARPSIKARLEQVAQDETLSKYVADVERRWRPMTLCRPGYVIEVCAGVKTAELGATTPPAAGANPPAATGTAPEGSATTP